MAAILRVKRKKDDEPSDALLISCKRAKIEDEAAALEESNLTTIVKFAGTIDKPEDSAVENITKSLGKDYLKSIYKQHYVNINEKIRELTKNKSNENRFKLVSKKRSIGSTLDEPLQDVNIIDIDDTQTTSEQKKNDEFVYDLYYTQMQDELELENVISILPIHNEELVFDDYYRDEQECDTSDSNSESNWRNDYPSGSDESEDECEEEPDESFNQASIKAFNKLGIDVNELSSDDEDYVYGGLDEKDVEEYGYKYAKYKANLKNEESNESEEIDDYYYAYCNDDYINDDDDDEDHKSEKS